MHPAPAASPSRPASPAATGMNFTTREDSAFTDAEPRRRGGAEARAYETTTCARGKGTGTGVVGGRSATWGLGAVGVRSDVVSR